jgi:hypothetical protein
MSDAEILDLIQHNRFAISPQCGGGWVIETSSAETQDGDADVLEVARTRGDIRDAIRTAIRNLTTGDWKVV